MALTPVWCCGFECGFNGAAAPHISTFLGTASISTATVRTGTYSLRTNPTAAQSSAGNNGGEVTGTVGVARSYINVSTAPSVSMGVIGFTTASSFLCGLGYNTADSKWYPCSDDGTTFTKGASGVTLSAGWHLVDVKVVVTSNPWTIDVQVDGSALTQLTIASAATTVNQWRWGHDNRVASYDIYHDDTLFSLTAADYPIGAGKVRGHSPTRDGTHTFTGTNAQIGAAGANITVTSTNTYTFIDDIPISSGGTSDFLTQLTSSPTQYVEHGYASMATGTAGPRAVEILMRHHKVSTAGAGFRWKLNDNGTTALLLNYLSSAAGSSGPTYQRKQYATMVGGASWTLARFNGILTRWGYSTDANPDVSLDAALIEAEWDASGQAADQPVTATGNYGVGTLGMTIVPNIPVQALSLSGLYIPRYA